MGIGVHVAVEVLAHRLGAAVVDHPAVVEPHDPGDERCQRAELVEDHDDGDAAGHQLARGVGELDGAVVVDAGQRFVEHQHLAPPRRGLGRRALRRCWPPLSSATGGGRAIGQPDGGDGVEHRAAVVAAEALEPALASQPARGDDLGRPS